MRKSFTQNGCLQSFIPEQYRTMKCETSTNGDNTNLRHRNAPTNRDIRPFLATTFGFGLGSSNAGIQGAVDIKDGEELELEGYIPAVAAGQGTYVGGPGGPGGPGMPTGPDEDDTCESVENCNISNDIKIEQTTERP